MDQLVNKCSLYFILKKDIVKANKNLCLLHFLDSKSSDLTMIKFLKIELTSVAKDAEKLWLGVKG